MLWLETRSAPRSSRYAPTHEADARFPEIPADYGTKTNSPIWKVFFIITILTHKAALSTVPAQAESVVPLPCRHTRRVVVPVAFPDAPVLAKSFESRNTSLLLKHTCFPMLVRPRASRLLCTGLAIQLIRASRRI